jgi:formamidopyrimidine-DNA glycosylase
MPELPEVQTVVDQLNRQGVVGRTITAAAVYWPNTIGRLTPDQFCNRIRGRAIRQIDRRGKYIVLRLAGRRTLLIHLRMSGRLVWTTATPPRGKHEHVVLEIDHHYQLRFHDTRKFGRLILTDRPEAILDTLGLEPLAAAFTGKGLQALLYATRRQIKPLLLDQHVIAGLGNIYVDESLWQAGIHPLRNSSSLTDAEITRLHRAIRQVLRKGIRNMGTSLGRGKSNFFSADNRPGRNADTLKVFRRTGDACPRCGATIQRIVVGQRSSHICPVCQEAPRGPSVLPRL